MKKDYPVAFEEVWTLFPKRTPDNPKRMAFKAWQARVNEGSTIADLKAATEGYAKSVRARRLEGTEKVLMGATFWGPNERWQEYLPKPETVSERPVAPRRAIPEERPDAGEGLVSIRGIIESLTRAKVSPVKHLKVGES